MAKRLSTTSRRDVLATIAPAALLCAAAPAAAASPPPASPLAEILDRAIEMDRVAGIDPVQDIDANVRRAIDQVIKSVPETRADLLEMVRAYTIGQNIRLFNIMWVQTRIMHELRAMMLRGAL